MSIIGLISIGIIADIVVLTAILWGQTKIHEHISKTADERDGKLDWIKKTIDNSLFRLSHLEDRLTSNPNDGNRGKGDPEKAGTLTMEGIEASVRRLGYVPERHESWIRFMAAGEACYIETCRLPVVFLFRWFSLNPKDWEIDLLKQAAHLMADEIIMVKATFDEEKEKTHLRFLVAALDANDASFCKNLPRYLSIIEDGRRTLNEIYESLVKERQDAAMSLAPLLPSSEPQEKKVLS